MTKNHDSLLLRTLIKLYEFNGNQHHCVASLIMKLNLPSSLFHQEYKLISELLKNDMDNTHSVQEE